METSDEIKQRARALAEKTDVNSITPKEVGGIMYDLASHGENVLRNGGTLGIRKVYESVAAMEADSTNPKDFWGDPIKKGNLVVIYDGTTTGVDNNKIYAFMKPGWELATKLDAAYATKAETDAKLTELGSKVSQLLLKESIYDFSISDDYGNAILGISDGHIKTKNFDSRDLSRCHYSTFAVLGDSYSTFANKTNPTDNRQWYPTNLEGTEGYGTDNDVVKIEQTWWYLFANEYKSVLLENNSYSGSTICYDGYSVGHDSLAAKISFCMRAEQMQTKPELMFIFGGTNDAWAKSELGEYKYSDWTEEDKSYFRPALAYLIDYIRANMIGTTIVFILNNGLKSNVATSIHTICEHYEVKIVELSNIDKLSSHPSIKGMEQIKEQIIKAI